MARLEFGGGAVIEMLGRWRVYGVLGAFSTGRTHGLIGLVWGKERAIP